jgi:hypothetical protein
MVNDDRFPLPDDNLMSCKSADAEDGDEADDEAGILIENLLTTAGGLLSCISLDNDDADTDADVEAAK